MAPTTEDELLAASHRELDALFRVAPAGPAPRGVLDGTALLVPGRPGRVVAALVRALAWQGKVVDPDGTSLRNRITPLGLRAVTAAVRPDASRLDGQPCTVFDYAGSLVARGVRDEVRLVAPGLYLGLVWLFGVRVARFAVRERPGHGLPPTPAARGFARLAVAVDDRRRWDRWPTWVALALIKGIRDHMRWHNLYDTNDEASTPELDPEPPPRALVARTIDGSYNDLSAPAMGMVGTRLGRNVPPEHTAPEPPDRLLRPNPRRVSTALLARGPEMIPATSLNVIAAAWLQFQTRDWFSHGTDPHRTFAVPRPAGDTWPDDPILLPRTAADPTAQDDPAAPDSLPGTFANTETHWWDASQLYGSTPEFQRAIRRPELGPGKVAVGPDGLVDLDPAVLGSSGGLDGWWIGLELLHTVFLREHNALCDVLHAAYPAWDDDQVFDKARLVVAALNAKIHTVEWTTAILAHPVLQIGMRANWFGLAEERVHRLLGRISGSEIISGIPGSDTDHHAAPYSITEEFVGVYRMHPLVPDELVLRSTADPDRADRRPFLDVAGLRSRAIVREHGVADLFYSLGTAHPGAVTLHNHPRFLQRFRRTDGREIDLAAVDVLRSRERGVPRYNAFRRLLALPPARSFLDLTKDPATAGELADVYDSIEDVDLTVGLYAEPLPAGFGFSDTAFRIFILMASRRLKSDRFFTTDFTPAVYTPEGMKWIDDTDMSSLLTRHYPQLAPALRGVRNAFAPWPLPDGVDR